MIEHKSSAMRKQIKCNEERKKIAEIKWMEIEAIRRQADWGENGMQKRTEQDQL